MADAAALAFAVAEFFPPEYYVGGRILSLARDLQHAALHLKTYPKSWSLDAAVPEAAVRARFVERFLLERGAAEIAVAFGRARTLHDNGPFIVIFAGMTSGIASYALFSFLLGTYTPLPAVIGASATWLSIAIAVISGLAVAVEVGVAINEVLKGEHVVPAWPLVALTLQSIPASERHRYDEEFRAEIYPLGLVRQLSYSVNVLLHAWELRRSLTPSASADDAPFSADGT